MKPKPSSRIQFESQCQWPPIKTTTSLVSHWGKLPAKEKESQGNTHTRKQWKRTRKDWEFTRRKYPRRRNKLDANGGSLACVELVAWRELSDLTIHSLIHLCWKCDGSMNEGARAISLSALFAHWRGWKSLVSRSQNGGEVKLGVFWHDFWAILHHFHSRFCPHTTRICAAP